MAEPTALGQSETIDGKTYISRGIGTEFYWGQPDVAESVVRYPLSGAPVYYHPVENTPTARGTTLSNALSAAANGDTIVLAERRYEMSGAGGWSLASRYSTAGRR